MEKKMLTLGMLLALSMMLFVGCGNADNNNAATDQRSAVEATDDRNDIDRNDVTETSPARDDSVVDDLKDGAKDAADGVGDAVDDAVDGAGDAAKDVIDGAEGAVDETTDAIEDDDRNTRNE